LPNFFEIAISKKFGKREVIVGGRVRGGANKHGR
jgi:hypothetical protein